MLKKIRSTLLHSIKTLSPAVRYIFYKPDRVLKTCQVYKRMPLPSGLFKTFGIPDNYYTGSPSEHKSLAPASCHSAEVGIFCEQAFA